jgi:hypothetical protein
VFMPIMVMGLAIRQHVLQNFKGRVRFWGSTGATFAAVLSGVVFVGQITGKWSEGGWVVLISFSVLAILAHFVLRSPIGFREPNQIHRIVRDKARIQGSMASIVEWQSLKMQEYRYTILVGISKMFALLGVRRPVRYEQPVFAGAYNDAVHSDSPDAQSFLAPYLTSTIVEPHIGGQPNVTEAPEEGTDQP